MLARMSARATGQDTAIEETSKDRGMQVQLLGGFAVLVDGRAVPESAWRLRRAKDVVKLLALAQSHRLHREQVMEALWPERSPEAAANNLHQALHVARRALRAAGGGPELLRLRDGVLDLCPEEDLVVDADIYLAAARAARVSGDLADCLVARALYRGELLPDDRYEEWTVARREALEQDHLSLVWDLAARQSEAADMAGAIETRGSLSRSPASPTRSLRLRSLRPRGRPTPPGAPHRSCVCSSSPFPLRPTGRIQDPSP
jgi:DNA-binding SARP family transcriptional activator